MCATLGKRRVCQVLHGQTRQVRDSPRMNPLQGGGSCLINMGGRSLMVPPHPTRGWRRYKVIYSGGLTTWPDGESRWLTWNFVCSWRIRMVGPVVWREVHDRVVGGSIPRERRRWKREEAGFLVVVFYQVLVFVHVIGLSVCCACIFTVVVQSRGTPNQEPKPFSLF